MEEVDLMNMLTYIMNTIIHTHCKFILPLYAGWWSWAKHSEQLCNVLVSIHFTALWCIQWDRRGLILTSCSCICSYAGMTSTVAMTTGISAVAMTTSVFTNTIALATGVAAVACQLCVGCVWGTGLNSGGQWCPCHSLTLETTWLTQGYILHGRGAESENYTNTWEAMCNNTTNVNK